MTKGSLIMDLLIIDENEAKLCSKPGQTKLVSQVTPEDISLALEYLLESDQVGIASDEDESKITNPAQKIIFQQLRTSFKEILDSRETILGEIDAAFHDAEDKYLGSKSQE